MGSSRQVTSSKLGKSVIHQTEKYLSFKLSTQMVQLLPQEYGRHVLWLKRECNRDFTLATPEKYFCNKLQAFKYIYNSKGKEKPRSVLISIAARTGPKIRSYIGGVSTLWKRIHL